MPFLRPLERFFCSGWVWVVLIAILALIVILLLHRARKKAALNRRRTAVWAGCWAYVVVMGVSRVVIGRHYPSDTLAAMFVMTLLLFAVRSSRPYRRRLEKLPDI